MSIALSEPQAPDLGTPSSADTRAGAVLQAFIAKSAYRSMLEPISKEIERVAFENVQIRAALELLARNPAPPSRFWQRPRAEEAVVLSFLEYVAFASPAFLASVGEWPLGQIRG